MQTVSEMSGHRVARTQEHRRVGSIPPKYFVDTLLPIPDNWIKAQNALLDLLHDEPALSTATLCKLYCSYDGKLGEIIHYRQNKLAGKPIREKTVTRLFRNELTDILGHLTRLCQELEGLLYQIHLAGPDSALVQQQIIRIGEDPAIRFASWLDLTASEQVIFSYRKKALDKGRVVAPIDKPETLDKLQPAIHNLWSALRDLPKLPEII